MIIVSAKVTPSASDADSSSRESKSAGPCTVGDHLGYRFELTEAIFDPVHSRTEPLTVALTIVNRGFSAMHNPRPVYVVLLSSANELVFHTPVDVSPGDWVSLPLAFLKLQLRVCEALTMTVFVAVFHLATL